MKNRKLAQVNNLLPFSQEKTVSLKNSLKIFKKEIRNSYNIDFDKIPLKKLRVEIEKAYKNNDEIAAYKLDVAADIKELMSDNSLDSQDFNFYIDSLLTFFFKE